MPAKRHRVFIWVGLLLALNWLSLAFVDLGAGGSEVMLIGNFFGSLFAQVTLVGAWTAFGPAPWCWRVLLSLIWVISLAFAVSINVTISGGPQEAVVIFGICLLGQWLLLQFPFWALALVWRLRLRHIDDIKQESDPGRFQFGIRHLLIVMAIASVVLGIGRMVALNIVGGKEVTLIFLAAVAIVLTLPLLLAALMRRMAIPGVLLALVLIGVATAWELPLAEMIGAAGPETGHFIAINAVSAILILVVAGILRAYGYFLGAQPAAATGWTD